MIINHRFLSHQIDPSTEILIIGTFNPDTEENGADFFYGRRGNYLWNLLPTAFGDVNLKGRPLKEKLEFIRKRKIDFIDLISQVDIEKGQEANYKDKFIDSKVTIWRDIQEGIERLININKICFTRKTLSDIPKMRVKVEAIQQYCQANHIKFQLLKTPSRTYSTAKQEIWTSFINL